MPGMSQLRQEINGMSLLKTFLYAPHFLWRKSPLYEMPDFLQAESFKIFFRGRD